MTSSLLFIVPTQAIATPTPSWIQIAQTEPGWTSILDPNGAISFLSSDGTFVAHTGARTNFETYGDLSTFSPISNFQACQVASSTSGNIIYVRDEAGAMYRSRNSGTSWTLLSTALGRGCAELETISTSPDGSSIVFSGYIDDDGWNIFYSSNYGESFTEISNEFTSSNDVFRNWKFLLLLDNRNLYAANANSVGGHTDIYHVVLSAGSATITAGPLPNSRLATIPSGATEATIPATTLLPATKLSFGGSVPTEVTVVPIASNPATPASTPFKIMDSTKIVDIQITGSFNGSATVCLDGSTNDHIFHFTGGQWVELASRSYDSVNGQVCGVTTSFSPFAAAEPAPINTSPDAPASVVATATGKRTATVGFTAPSSNGGSVITSYSVTSTPGGVTKTLTQAGSGSFSVDGLQPGTSYTFAVTAKNANGTSSATTSNLIKTSAGDVASLATITFTDDGSGTGGKLAWVGKNIDSVLYTGPASSYPGTFNFGAFSSSWNGSLRNLTPETTYTISVYAISVDGVGEAKSLTFKTGVKTDVVKNLAYWNTWLTDNTYFKGEVARLFGLLNKFNSLETSAIRSFIKVPVSLASTVSAISLTPKSCSVVSTTAKVDAGMVKALTKDICTISYTVSGPSKAPATLVKDFVFKKVG